MNESRFVEFCTARTDQGTYIAATNESPYFCFEGANEHDVLEKVKRALRVYGMLDRDVVKVDVIPQPTLQRTWKGHRRQIDLSEPSMAD